VENTPNTYSSTSTSNRSILPTDMISVQEARNLILEKFTRLEPILIPIVEAIDQVTAKDVIAKFDIPPHANTGMDGYAVKAEDTKEASFSQPKKLSVIGYLPAGKIFNSTVMSGQAVRIMTGAPIPMGTDAIVPFEETDEYREETNQNNKIKTEVLIDVKASVGANIRPAGEDIKKGTVVFKKGTILGPAQIAVLASLGLNSISVHRRPIVAVLSTGDELLNPGEPYINGKIYDSNSFGLAAQIKNFGGTPKILNIAKDTVESLTHLIRDGVENADFLITSAGVSRGDFDLVKTVLAKEGQIGFWTVQMKPGKPLAFGIFTKKSGVQVPHLGLPGNPVSAMLTFELFGRPAIFKMLGKINAWPRSLVNAITKDKIINTDGRRFYARVVIDETNETPTVSLTGKQSSGILTSMSKATAFAICPSDTTAIEVGQPCEVILIDRENNYYGESVSTLASEY